MELKILGVKDKSWFGKIVSFFRRSDVSHTAVLYNGMIYEMGLRGVQQVKEFDYRWEYETLGTLELNFSSFNDRLFNLKSNKYDFLAILMFYPNRLFKLRFGSGSKRMTCVEFVGALSAIYEFDYNVAPDEMKEICNKKGIA